MIVKQIISEELLTLGEVKDLLDRIKQDRETENKESGYELRKAIAHAEMFSRLDSKNSRELVNDLLKLEKMKPEIAIRIADTLPLSNDEIRSIYAKERYTLTEQELKQILEIVMKYA
ncbi:MAG: RNA polymerase Rpb4 family protein [Candidatus Methanoperedens sp.]|nr:RNA polymerase Rpb4 family protein [Candidatus Methanoperedens sp.]MCE8429060.1 RNA polymerase Rpb4 family protein [Candidatus Methanoperedens sp.]